MTVPVRAGRAPAARLGTVLVTGEAVLVVTELTMPVIAENVLAAVWLTGPGWMVGCGGVAEPWIDCVALWTMPMAAGEVGADGAFGNVAVDALMVPVTAASAPAAVGGLTRLTGLGWVIGCAPLVAELAEAWTVWVVLCTMPVTAWAAGAEGAAGVWAVWPASAAVLAATAGALAAVLAEAWLAGAAWTVGCEPPPDPCEPPPDSCEAAADPCEAAAGDPLAPVGPARAPLTPADPGRAPADPRRAPLAPADPGRVGIDPGRAGIWVADAGRAKIRARIKASMKAPARPPQAYRHARRVQTPTFASPTLEWMATFPSTACKPRQTLCYPTITLSARRTPAASSA